MKIALLTPLFENNYSGVATYARMLYKGIVDEGIESVVISPDLRKKEKNFIKINSPKLDITPNYWLSNAINYKKVLKSLNKKIDVAHFLDAREALFTPKSGTLKLLGTVHDSYSFDLGNLDLLKKYFSDWKKRFLYYSTCFYLEKKAYKKLDIIISNTNYVKQNLSKNYGINAGKINTIYIGSSIEKKPSYNLDVKSPLTISFIGGNFQRKGLIQLIKAVEKLNDDGIKTKIVIAGKDKTQLSIIRNLKYKNIVEFKGYIKPSDIPSFLKTSDMFAMPSITEAFGLVYLEAMACGVPAIGSINGGTNELINDGENGVLVDPENIDDIASKIKILMNADLRKKIVENGYKTLDKFSVQKSVEQTINCYKQLVNH